MPNIGLGGESAGSGCGAGAPAGMPASISLSGSPLQSASADRAGSSAGAPNLPPLIDSALVLRSQVRGRGATGSRLNENGGGNVRAYRVVVEAHNNADPQVPRQDHSGLCRGA